MVPEARLNPESIQKEPRTATEVIATPGIQEVIPPEAGLSTPTADESIEPGDRQEPGRPENEIILSATPEAESMADPPAPEYSVEAGPAVQEEAKAGADQTLSTEPEGGLEKTEGVPEKEEIGEKNK